jgi:hypothetical protein
MKLSTSPPPDNPRMYIGNKQGAEIKKGAQIYAASSNDAGYRFGGHIPLGSSGLTAAERQARDREEEEAAR